MDYVLVIFHYKEIYNLYICGTPFFHILSCCTGHLLMIQMIKIPLGVD